MRSSSFLQRNVAIMKYRTLGRTGLSVSEIGFGGEHIMNADYKTSEAIMRTAMDAGVNIMDVFMPQPDVRSHMGDALKGHRQEVILQGHIGAALQNGQYVRSRDPKLSEEYIQDFLTRFHTDYIDLGMMHFIDTEEDYQKSFHSEYIDYCLELKKRGIVRYLGVSSHNAVTAAKMVNSGLVDVVLFSINPAFDLLPAQTHIDDYWKNETYVPNRLTIDPERAAFYRLCEEKGVGITVMKTLGAGRLLDAERSSFGFALTPAQCIHYALERPAVASVLMGAKTVEEMQQSLAYETASDAEKDYSILGGGTKSSMNGKCMYCNHCLPCPAGLDVAAVNKYLDLAQQNNAPDTVRAHYDALEHHATDCIRCGMCETRCPFHVPVRENMGKAAEIFGK